MSVSFFDKANFIRISILLNFNLRNTKHNKRKTKIQTVKKIEKRENIFTKYKNTKPPTPCEDAIGVLLFCYITPSVGVIVTGSNSVIWLIMTCQK